MTLAHNDKKQILNSKLRTIRNLYLVELPNKITNMLHIWQQITEHHDAAQLRHLRIMLHSLAGSSGSFGLPDIQKQAEALENLIGHIEIENITQNSLIAEQLTKLKASAKHTSKVDIAHTDEQFVLNTQNSQQKHRILIVEDDHEQGDELYEQLMHYGYNVSLLRTIAQLPEFLQQNKVDLILCDVMHEGQDNAGFEIIARLRGQVINCQQMPILFLSARDDLNARLKAIRAGGIGYFHKPVRLSELIDRIEQLLTPPSFERRPHVLIVDDDKTLSQYHALLLEETGVETWTLSEPEKLLDTLRVFNPDLVIMDLYFPDCTGVELAAVIRQQNAYLGIPILFLSIEKEISEHLLAYTIGADDFLTKPIHPQHFVPLIVQKIRRFRQLRDLMLHDGLTGAFNHTTIKNMMDTELARCRREKQNMVVAMLDIDLFKQVNDQYGHPAGDRVLRDLAHLLHRRLRHTDFLGRYGGEEFMIVLSHTDIAMAEQFMNAIRAHFAEIIHEENEQQFRVTFSAGLAQFSDFNDGSSLIAAADAALYQAKGSGRNQICLAKVGAME